MTREQKVELANELLKAFGVDMFDHDGTLLETPLDALVALVNKHQGDKPAV